METLYLVWDRGELYAIEPALLNEEDFIELAIKERDELEWSDEIEDLNDAIYFFEGSMDRTVIEIKDKESILNAFELLKDDYMIYRD